MKKFKVQSAPKIIPLTLSVAIISVMMCLTITAWDPPSQTPPGNNAKAPINVGGAPQGKLGNLGIGTDNPTQKLDVRGSVSIGGNAGGNTNRLYLERNDANHYIYSTGTTGNNMYFGEWDGNFHFINTSGGTEVVTIKSGNVGIGTSSPDGTLYVARGTANGGTAVFAGTTNKSHFNYSVDEDTYIRGGKASSKVIINDNGGNVGIGTTTPGAKLDINGNTIARGELQSTMGSGLAQLRMVAGNYGAMLRNDGVNTYFLLTNSGDQYGSWNGLRPLYINNTSGDVTVGTRICLGGKCCSTWEECFSGVTPTPPPGAGNKRIFVTSIAYDSNQLFDRTRADQICQKHAKNLGGTYKALIYYCTTNATPYVALPAGARFWNCSTTDCFEVAENPMDFFTKNTGDDNYLKNPIKYDETGAASASPVAVWTGFTPNGSGGWTGQLCSPTGTPQGLCYSPKGSTAYTIYGSNFSKDIGWAHFANAAYSNPSVCLSQSRALYCVEQ